MLRIEQTTREGGPIYSTLTLRFEQRVKSRQKVTLDNGEEAGLMLPRGGILQPGHKLMAKGGEIIEVRAAREAVSTVYCEDAGLLTRAAYHLGNRHVALQIGEGFVRYLHDHVLDDLMRGLGLEVISEQASFLPESGAYHQGGHAHADHEH